MKTLFIITALLIVCATANGFENAPRITHIGPISPDIIAITVETGQVEYGVQQPYTPQDGDSINEPDTKHRWIIRDGKGIGALLGAEGKTMITFDCVTGDLLDIAWADKAESYSIGSESDPDYGAGLPPKAVYRKSKPTDIARTAAGKLNALIRHILYLKLETPLEIGIEYTLDFEGGKLAKQTFVYDPTRMRSEAVHVGHIGFRPKDPSKAAFLSCWIGSGGPMAYEPELAFHILDDKTGQPVFEGKTVLTKALTDIDEDSFNKNYNGTDVFMMDFTPLDEPGTYRVYVDEIGCSYPFKISEDTWRKAFTLSARGFYHQRSGIENGPPYSTYKRQRAFHPDDGMVVYASTTPIIGTGNGIKFGGGNFEALVKGKTDEIVQDAWGGLMDAGDWDRRIQHLDVSRSLLELALMYPDYFSKLSLNIPESNNDLTDIVDEALFNLDCYRRMQTPDGGIRGGIESAGHPRYGEASWQESLTVMAYAPGVWSSYIYAGVAARAAYWFEKHHPDGGAEVYRESAIRAMLWAEAKVAEGNYEKKFEFVPKGINDYRNLAAVELYRLTGTSKWHDIFRETTFLNVEGASISKYGGPKRYLQGKAAFVYINTDRPEVDKAIQAICSAALIKEADFYLNAQAKTGFRWIKHPARPSIGTFSNSIECAYYVIRAHKITGDEKYLRAAVLTCQTHTGANPQNMTYTTGLGHDYPRHPLQVDHRISNQPAPPGLTLVGPLDWDHFGGLGSPISQVAGKHCYPENTKWPIIENFMDTYWTNMMCEYTVHQFMAPTAYIWGYMAASSR